MRRRQYARQQIDIRVRLAILPDDAEQVALVGGRALSAQMTDISPGGAHLVVNTFLPRAARLELEIPPNDASPSGKAVARIMAVRMLNREPQYGLGLRFESADEELVAQLREAQPEPADGEART